MNILTKFGALVLGISLTLGLGLNSKSNTNGIDNKINEAPLAAVTPLAAVDYGTKDEPISVSDALSLGKDLTENQYLGHSVYIEGIVNSEPILKPAKKTKKYRMNLKIKDLNSEDTLFIYNAQDTNNKTEFKTKPKKDQKVIITGDLKRTNDGLQLCYNSSSGINCYILSFEDYTPVEKFGIVFENTTYSIPIGSEPLILTPVVGPGFGTSPVITWTLNPLDTDVISLASETGLTNTIEFLKIGSAEINVSVNNQEGTLTPVTTTLSFTVKAEPTLCDIQNIQDDQIFEGLAVVTDKQGSEGIFVADKVTGFGALCYKFDGTTVNIGDEVKIRGTVSTYQDVKQLKNVTLVSTTPISTGNVIEPIEFSDVTKINTKNASRPIKLTGAIYVKSRHDIGNKGDSAFGFKLNDKTFDLFCKGSTSSLGNTIESQLANDHLDMTAFDIICIPGFYNGNVQFYVTENVKAEVNNFASLIQTINGENKTGQCVKKLPIAQGYYNALTEQEKTLFQTSEDNSIATARERYIAWCANQNVEAFTGKKLPSNLVSFSDESSMIITIVCISVLAVTLIAALAIAKSRKHVKQ